MAVKEFLIEELGNLRELRYLQIEYNPVPCIGCWQCYEVCPIGLWTPDFESRKARFKGLEGCVACGACVLQRPGEAVRLLLQKD
jgi:NAD-dependent dihydropyrimidine dehydrogenase PreA subunit